MAEKPKIETVPIRFMSPDTQSEFRSSVVQDNGEDQDVTVFSAPDFIQMMMNRMGVSFHKYGSIDENFPHRARGLDQIEQRIQKYIEDGNLEWLIDAANYCLIEFLRPCHINAHFRSTDSDESPGRVNADGSISHGRD